MKKGRYFSLWLKASSFPLTIDSAQKYSDSVPHPFAFFLAKGWETTNY